VIAVAPGLGVLGQALDGRVQRREARDGTGVIIGQAEVGGGAAVGVERVDALAETVGGRGDGRVGLDHLVQAVLALAIDLVEFLGGRLGRFRGPLVGHHAVSGVAHHAEATAEAGRLHLGGRAMLDQDARGVLQALLLPDAHARAAENGDGQDGGGQQNLGRDLEVVETHGFPRQALVAENKRGRCRI
jgi:hypothetical protein